MGEDGDNPSDLARRVARSHLQRKESRSKTAGEVRFVTDKGPSDEERQIPGDFEYDSSCDEIKDLGRVLLRISKALGYLIPAQETFTRINGREISPDGKLGGHGYVKSIADIRKTLNESVDGLSAVVDTLDDELKAEHWKGEDFADQEYLERLRDVRDRSDEIIGNPDAFSAGDDDLERLRESDGE